MKGRPTQRRMKAIHDKTINVVRFSDDADVAVIKTKMFDHGALEKIESDSEIIVYLAYMSNKIQ